MNSPHTQLHAVTPARRRLDARRWWMWFAICTAAVLFMGILRLMFFPDRIVPFAYAIPLLLCLWNRDLRLLWGMAIAFTLILLGKVAMLLPATGFLRGADAIFAPMQIINILIPAVVIHAVIRLTDRLEDTVALLEQSNAELAATNEELAAREEEITQQNEELQSQTEELEQQTEELNTQTEELQALNEQLASRERTLGDLLETTADNADEAQTLTKLGETVERLLGSRACAAAVVEPNGADMIVHPLTGLPPETQRLKRDRTLAELVLTRDRAGCLPDVALRPDLDPPRLAEGGTPRSIAAAPFRLGDHASGALEIYSNDTGEWSEHDLRIVQWLAEQCGRLWTTSRLRSQLTDHQRLLSTVTDNSTVALFMTDADGNCTYLNPAAHRLLGYAQDDLAGRSLNDIIYPAAARDRAHHSLARRVRPVEDELVRKDGQILPVLISTNPVVSDGRQVALVIEVRDATEQRRHEQEREQLLESERAARAEAERANRAKDEFVATLSHELRTPLHAVMGWASILRKNDCANVEEVRKGVEVIERNARHQSQLISDLLDISRITAGKIHLDVQPVDLPLVVESAIESVRFAADAKGVALERMVDPVDREIMGDAGRLQQVVWNLLTNAIKFTPQEGRVQVVVTRVASYVKIAVSDTGEGIDPEVLPHLFDRYRQADGSSSRRHAGLGIGLTIARHLVELHGGSIHAHSAGLGRGATFSVLLPVRAAQRDDHADDGRLLPGAADSDAPALSALSILIVDDESDARELIRHILTERGATVDAVSSADAALRHIAERPPHLLISDVGMPDMDGYAFIRAVRDRWPDSARTMPAIALTAFARSEDRTRALLAGFQSHIAKPVEPAELVATVATLAPAPPSADTRRPRPRP